MAIKQTRGFTLTEAMLTVLILGILSTVAAPIMRNLTNFWRQTTARNEIQRDVRKSLDLINRFLRQAQSNTIVLDQVTNQPPYSRIAFTTEAGVAMSFYQTGNKLYMTSGAKTSMISDRLGFIAFTFPRTDDVSIISVAITMQAATYLGAKKTLQLSIQKVRIMNT